VYLKSLCVCNTRKTCESRLKTDAYSGHMHMKTYIHVHILKVIPKVFIGVRNVFNSYQKNTHFISNTLFHNSF
jgi:hypothetical protein